VRFCIKDTGKDGIKIGVFKFNAVFFMLVFMMQ